MAQKQNLLRQGNKSSLIAATVNTIIAIIKGIAYFFTGNVAMFAETMHSLGDAANQFFVFIGSALSKKMPTEQYPNGFGRLVNLVLLGAVIIVGIMSYETIKEGYHHLLHPTESTGIIINLSVLGLAVLLEAFVLYKAMKEVLHETGIEAKGLGILAKSFTGLKKAKPATKLVFMEDLVATMGGIIAIIGILLSYFAGLHAAEGIASIIIGIMMFYVVGKVFLDNAKGVLGEADEELEEKIGQYIFTNHPEIRDIKTLYALKEGEDYHIEMKLEIDASISVKEAIALKNIIEGKIQEIKGVTDVIIEFDQDDGLQTWT
ncbi:cation diffusion facilitator family transporter [Mesobacillus maritimus]|uniref:cation diffusion facilitator family transporter n=1 Tax=Mesobacillus maritimus TaxID=1643336 RepID=UPI00203D82F1|nr:cation diffusion facilitator family transporter [Mesobacillus maritimus]MCM3586663.1 cation diffusion facilitator family transporter [Mesobacillus maritimus]MCM3668584.1 cation diffusion facilitator family transporter [Mesobacillus maritimus]